MTNREPTHTIKILLLAAVIYAEKPALAEEDNRGGLAGPVPLRIISPLRLWFYQFSPERAKTLGKGSWNARFEYSESNVLHLKNVPATEFNGLLNLEISRFNFNFRYGISDRWDLGLEIPVYTYHDGFLDGFITDVEGLFGKVKVRRKFKIDFPFYSLERNLQPFFTLGDDKPTGVGDVTVTAKRILRLRDGWMPALAARGAIKTPTGDEDDAMGSGRADLSLGLAAEYEWRRFGLDANLGSTFPLGNRFEDQGLDTKPIFNGHLGFEYRKSRKWSWHLQFAAMSAPYSFGTSPTPTNVTPGDKKQFTGAIYQITPAGAWRPRPSTTIFFGFVEDLISSDNSASDFTFFITIQYGKAR